MCGAAAAKGPDEDAGEGDAKCSAKAGEKAKAGEGMAEEEFGGAGLEGDDRAVVDVAPGEVAAAGNVVELVAEVAVADVALPESAGEVDEQFERAEEEREVDCRAEGIAVRLGGHAGWSVRVGGVFGSGKFEESGGKAGFPAADKR